MKRHFRDKAWMRREPRSAQELYLSTRDASQELGHELGRSPTTAEIATRLDVGEDRVLEAMEAGQAYTPSSLDVYGPDGEQTIDIPITDTSFAAAIDREQLRTLLPRLDQRESLILKRIYFDGETQQQVASHIGASQMQVSRRWPTSSASCVSGPTTTTPAGRRGLAAPGAGYDFGGHPGAGRSEPRRPSPARPPSSTRGRPHPSSHSPESVCRAH